MNVQCQSRAVSSQPSEENLARREEAVFNAALDVPPQFRADYLKRACGGDARLLAQVEDLVQALGQSGGPDETTSIGAFLKDKNRLAPDLRARRD